MRKLAAQAANAVAHLAEVNAGARALVQAIEPVVLGALRVGLARQPYHVHRVVQRPGTPATWLELVPLHGGFDSR